MKKSIVATAMAGLLGLSALAQAGQHPNAQERAALDEALTGAGYISWGEIELEHGYWEVDDARKQAGALQTFDLKLDPASLQVVSEQLDD